MGRPAIGADAIAHVVGGDVLSAQPAARPSGVDMEAMPSSPPCPQAFRRQERAVTPADYGK